MTLRSTSGIGGSGGGIGLKSAGVLAQSAVPASVTGTLSETVLATIAIPAGAMGANGVLRITELWSFTNSANNKIARAKLGGTTIGTNTVTTVAAGNFIRQLRNRTASSQVIFPGSVIQGYGTTAAANGTSSIDTAVAQSLTITAQLADVTETMTLEGYTVEILNP